MVEYPLSLEAKTLEANLPLMTPFYNPLPRGVPNVRIAAASDLTGIEIELIPTASPKVRRRTQRIRARSKAHLRLVRGDGDLPKLNRAVTAELAKEARKRRKEVVELACKGGVPAVRRDRRPILLERSFALEEKDALLKDPFNWRATIDPPALTAVEEAELLDEVIFNDDVRVGQYSGVLEIGELRYIYRLGRRMACVHRKPDGTYLLLQTYGRTPKREIEPEVREIFDEVGSGVELLRFDPTDEEVPRHVARHLLEEPADVDFEPSDHEQVYA